MEYFQAEIIYKNTSDVEIISALLENIKVDSIWEQDDRLIAYFKTEDYNDISILEKSLSDLLIKIDVNISCSVLENQNWNAQWESNFDPVEIGKFCFIYAEFHDRKEGFEHYIKIAPKMAFGTGHHATTFMMMETMKDVSFSDKKVLDLGCGSGILSVLAYQLGARDINAIDIEQPSYENSLEHSEMNNTPFIVFCGGVEDVPKLKYDVILANINKGVLLTYVDQIKNMLNHGGVLILSGILKKDKELIIESYSDLNLKGTKNKGKWLCFEYNNN